MFEEWLQKGNEFIKEVAQELSLDNPRALRITTAVFHALRDRLSPDEAKDLVSQLPMILKAIWCDEWNPAHTPDKSVKKKEHFLERVMKNPKIVRSRDLSSLEDAEKAVAAVFKVLKRHLAQGEIEDIADQLPEDIRGFWLQ